MIALAVGEALGAPVEQVMPAALAIELVHTFSLVHDDLPGMDNDEERRGQPSTWKKFGDGTAVLAGDALLAEAVRLAARYESSAVARELAEATLGMIGGQYLDTMVDGYDLAAVHRLKTGRLFYASVTMALCAAELPEDGAGAVACVRRGARASCSRSSTTSSTPTATSASTAPTPRGATPTRLPSGRGTRLDEVAADTSVLREIVDGLAVRTA